LGGKTSLKGGVRVKRVKRGKGKEVGTRTFTGSLESFVKVARGGKRERQVGADGKAEWEVVQLKSGTI